MTAYRAHRALVLASLPSLCAVCTGTREVQQVELRGSRTRRVRCPHCVSHLPVIHLPWRNDTPKRSA